MPDYAPPLIDDDGRLQDFEGRHGEEAYARLVGIEHGRRRRWGNRQLLAVQPDDNPLLGGLTGKNSATLIDTGDLGKAYPINVQIRFALLVGNLNLPPGTVLNGQPQLPFTDLCPFVGSGGAPEIDLIFTVRRGVDPLAPVTQDRYLMPNIGTLPDAAPFDTITTRTLGVDVEIVQHGLPSNPARIFSNLWIEAVAVVDSQVGQKDLLPGYVELLSRGFFAASAAPVLFLEQRVSRCQFFACNTSKTSDLYVLLGASSLPASPTNASIVLLAGGANIYESPVGGFAGQVSGVWTGGTLDGGALITEGTQKSVFVP
jgi:hypothetical protein